MSYKDFTHSSDHRALPWRGWLPKPNDAGIAGVVEDAVSLSILDSGPPFSVLSRIEIKAYLYTPLKDLLLILKGWGQPKVLHQSADSHTNYCTSLWLEWNDGLLFFSPPSLLNDKTDYDLSSKAVFTIRGREEWALALRQLILENTAIKSTAARTKVYALGKNYNGRLDLKGLELKTQSLQEVNYCPEVIEGFKHVLKDLLTPLPCGRLSLFLGPPGTGKTFALKGIVEEISRLDQVKCIIIPSGIIQSLEGPDIISLLSNEDDIAAGMKHILFTEDADEALISRGADNLSAISSLLNMTDGILGQALDIRVVATSNASKTQIDSAIKRPGRLCRQLNFRPLSLQEAQVVTNTLGKPPLLEDKKSWTLAEVYAWQGMEGELQVEHQIGFRK